MTRKARAHDPAPGKRRSGKGPAGKDEPVGVGPGERAGVSAVAPDREDPATRVATGPQEASLPPRPPATARRDGKPLWLVRFHRELTPLLRRAYDANPAVGPTVAAATRLLSDLPKEPAPTEAADTLHKHVFNIVVGLKPENGGAESVQATVAEELGLAVISLMEDTGSGNFPRFMAEMADALYVNGKLERAWEAEEYLVHALHAHASDRFECTKEIKIVRFSTVVALMAKLRDKQGDHQIADELYAKALNIVDRRGEVPTVERLSVLLHIARWLQEHEGRSATANARKAMPFMIRVIEGLMEAPEYGPQHLKTRLAHFDLGQLALKAAPEFSGERERAYRDCAAREFLQSIFTLAPDNEEEHGHHQKSLFGLLEALGLAGSGVSLDQVSDRELLIGLQALARALDTPMRGHARGQVLLMAGQVFDLLDMPDEVKKCTRASMSALRGSGAPKGDAGVEDIGDTLREAMRRYLLARATRSSGGDARGQGAGGRGVAAARCPTPTAPAPPLSVVRGAGGSHVTTGAPADLEQEGGSGRDESDDAPHDGTAAALKERAGSLLKQNGYAEGPAREAVGLLREALRLDVERNGKSHVDTASSYVMLGDALRRVPDLRVEAVELYRDAVDAERAAVPTPDGRIRAATYMLGLAISLFIGDRGQIFVDVLHGSPDFGEGVDLIVEAGEILRGLEGEKVETLHREIARMQDIVEEVLRASVPNPDDPAPATSPWEPPALDPASPPAPHMPSTIAPALTPMEPPAPPLTAADLPISNPPAPTSALGRRPGSGSPTPSCGSSDDGCEALGQGRVASGSTTPSRGSSDDGCEALGQGRVASGSPTPSCGSSDDGCEALGQGRIASGSPTPSFGNSDDRWVDRVQGRIANAVGRVMADHPGRDAAGLARRVNGLLKRLGDGNENAALELMFALWELAESSDAPPSEARELTMAAVLVFDGTFVDEGYPPDVYARSLQLLADVQPGSQSEEAAELATQALHELDDRNAGHPFWPDHDVEEIKAAAVATLGRALEELEAQGRVEEASRCAEEAMVALRGTSREELPTGLVQLLMRLLERQSREGGGGEGPAQEALASEHERLPPSGNASAAADAGAAQEEEIESPSCTAKRCEEDLDAIVAQFGEVHIRTALTGLRLAHAMLQAPEYRPHVAGVLQNAASAVPEGRNPVERLCGAQLLVDIADDLFDTGAAPTGEVVDILMRALRNAGGLVGEEAGTLRRTAHGMLIELGVEGCGFAGCGAMGVRLRACQGCMRKSYCGKECQKRDWNEGMHKKVCRKRRESVLDLD